MNSESATLNKYYKLTENINPNNTSNPNRKNTAKRWFTLISVRATNQCSFKGYFDGDGHIVRGLYIKYERPEYEEDENYAALFPVIGKTASVRGVGLDESEIDSTGSGFIGGIVGYITYWDTEDENEDKNVYTHITECFGSKTVVIKGKCVGGILGASPSPLYARDCYFIGQLTPDEQSTKPGGIIGNTWTPLDFRAVVENCYVATPNGDKIVGSRNRNVRNINAYTTVLDYDGASTLSLLRMKGEVAKTNMKGLDFKNVWKTVSAGDPVLRIFNSERYTNTDEPQKVEISFATNGGNEV